jgi:hypothetical protein
LEQPKLKGLISLDGSQMHYNCPIKFIWILLKSPHFFNHLLTFDYLHIDVLCISTIIPFITHNVYILILFLGIVGDIFIFI